MKNLIHTPCQMVIHDDASGHSLIAVFNELKLQFPPGTEIPSNAVIAREWALFSKWEMDKEEEGRDYISTTEIFWPDGTLFSRSELKAGIPVANGMAFILRMNGFPMGQTGRIRISNTLSESGKVTGDPIETAIRLHHQFDLVSRPADGNI